MNLETIEMKAFVPARDLTQSIVVYQALGFEVSMESDDVAYVQYGKTALLLSQFYLREHAENFVMHLLIENADDWHRNVEASVSWTDSPSASVHRITGLGASATSP